MLLILQLWQRNFNQKLRQALQKPLKSPNFASRKTGKMAEWSIATVLKTAEGHTSGGSNPSLSAKSKDKTAVSQRLAAVLILYTYKNTYKLPDNPSPIQMRLYHGKPKGGKKIL